MLRVRIHHQSDDPIGFSKVWDKILTGWSAEQTASSLEHLRADPMLQGEMLSLRIKDGDGGGCETSGSFLEVKIEDTEENRQTADVYFHADKWREW